MNVRIRAATAADLPQLVALEQASFDTDRISPRQLRHLVTRAHAAVLVAADGARLTGSAVVLYSRATGVARIYSLAVSASARGHGIGRMLLEAAAADARSRGRRRLRLEVRPDNTSAVALYERLGFHRIAEIDDYYQDHSSAWRYERGLAEVPDA